MGVYQISDIKHENTTSEYLGFRLITLGGSFIACIIYSLITCPLSSILTITLYFIFKAVGLVIDIMHGLDQVNRRMDFIGKSFILQGVSTLAAFTVVFGLTQSLDLAIMAMTAAAFGVLFLFDLPHSRTFESYGVHITAKKTFYLLKRSFSAVLASLACSAIYTAPKQLLLVMVSDAALGIYSSAAAPALVVQMGATYLYAPLLDVFARHHYERNKQEMLRLLKRTALGVIAIGIVCYIGAGLLGEWALCLLFGESIRPYAYLLQPVVVTSVATAFLWFFGDLLVALRSFRGYFLGNAIALASVVPLGVFCIQQWGMNGVSFAATAASFIGAATMALFLATIINE